MSETDPGANEQEPSAASDSATPFVSVIIPVYNDTERLARTLTALEAQTYPTDRYEVVVVDNASKESPQAVVDAAPHATLTSESKTGSYAARNQGLRVARGDWLAFTDADCLPAPAWLEAGVGKLREIGGRGIVAGYTNRFASDPDRPTATELYEIVTIPDPRPRAEKEGWAITGNLFTHREVFEAVGTFDERHKSWGDKEWGLRASAGGFPVVYCAEAHVETPARQRLKQHLVKSRRLVGGVTQLRVRREPESRSRLARLPWGRVLPPVGELAGLVRDRRLHGLWQRAQVAWVGLLTHYTKGFEHLRLLLGGEAERR